MFEHKSHSILPLSAFISRLLKSVGLGGLLVLFSLGIGIAGYRIFEEETWINSFLNASMMLAGMGEITSLKTDAGKIFASFYALYCGLALVTIIGIIFAPVAHRFLHKFHK